MAVNVSPRHGLSRYSRLWLIHIKAYVEGSIIFNSVADEIDGNVREALKWTSNACQMQIQPPNQYMNIGCCFFLRE